MVYEVVVEEKCQYAIIASGANPLEAQQDALNTYRRLARTGELVANTLNNPRVITAAPYGEAK